MKFRQARRVRWLPKRARIVGGLAATVGIFMVIFSMTALALHQRSPEVPPHGAVYVGGSTCYTCHSDAFDDWSLTLTVQTTANPAPKLRMVASDPGLTEPVRQVNVDQIADSCTAGSFVAPAVNSVPQRYIVSTEQGNVVLPGKWEAPDTEITIPGRISAAYDNCQSIGSIRDIFSVEPTALRSPATADQLSILRTAQETS